MKTETTDHAYNNAAAWMETIRENVEALEATPKADAEQELRSIDDEAELEAAEAKVEEMQDDDEAQEAARAEITNSALSVEVRAGWHAPGEESEPEEFKILLTTGGPALWIEGDLDDNNEPDRARLMYQDWGTVPTEYIGTADDRAAILEFARCFYFGE